MKSSKKFSKTSLVFFGNERLATGLTTHAPVLKTLIAEGYDIEAVIANNEDSQSRKQRELEVKQVAAEHHIPVYLPTSVKELKEVCTSLTSDIAVLVAYGRIVPQSVIDMFPKGIINIHPSLLPKHRGPTPIESIILNGEKETGVSIMQLTKEMDAGPVYVQTHCVLSGMESKQELANTLVQQGTDALLETLPKILDGSLQPKEQDDAQATYDQRIDKKAGVIDWNKAAVQIEREIRAYAHWPRSRTLLANIDIVITKAHAVPSNDPDKKPGDISIIQEKDMSALMIECANGYLCVDRLIPAGKKEMPVDAFLRGYGSQLST